MELASLVVKKASLLTAIDALDVPFQMVLGKELGGAFQKVRAATHYFFYLFYISISYLSSFSNYSIVDNQLSKR